MLGAGAATGTVRITAPSTTVDAYLYIAQVVGAPDLTSILLNGSQSLSGFMKGTVSFTDEGGTYEYWRSANSLSAAAYSNALVIVERG